MSNPPPPLPYSTPQVDQTSNLNTLSIFYFIIAGMQALAGLIPLVYVILGVFFGVVAVAGSRNAGDAGVGVGFAAFFICLGVAISLFIWFLAFLNYKVGRGLRDHKNLTLIYIMAGLACLSFPLGTILGVFTFVCLSKPGVKETFT